MRDCVLVALVVTNMFTSDVSEPYKTAFIKLSVIFFIFLIKVTKHTCFLVIFY